MGKRTAILLLAMVFLSLAVDYSLIRIKSKTFNEPKLSERSENTDAGNTKGEKIELNLWVNYSGLEWAADDFNKKNPGITVKVTVISYQDFTKTCLDAIAKGEGPDLIVCDSSLISSFNGNESLQNLLEEPFSAGQYRKGFRDDVWKLMSSFDQKRIIGIATEINPLVTFYRADIMEQYGFPSDPEKLSEYMKDPKNWLNIAENLIKGNKYIAQGTTDPFTIYEAGTGLFDEKLNFLRNTDDFKTAVDISRTIYKKGLFLSSDMWSEKGKKDLKDGNLVMMYSGTWAWDYIKSIAPEQAGKWRVTALPFGVVGWGNSNLASIAATSKHKAEAWKFIKDTYLSSDWNMGNTKIPAFLEDGINTDALSYKESFLGDQDILPLFWNLASRMRTPVVTPLDDKAKVLWDGYKYNFINYDSISPEDSIKQFEEELNGKLGKDKEALLKSIGR